MVYYERVKRTNTDSMAQEVVDLVNQGLTRQQIVAKLANHNDQTVYKIIARVLATTASEAQLATELTASVCFYPFYHS